MIRVLFYLHNQKYNQVINLKLAKNNKKLSKIKLIINFKTIAMTKMV